MLVLTPLVIPSGAGDREIILATETAGLSDFHMDLVPRILSQLTTKTHTRTRATIKDLGLIVQIHLTAHTAETITDLEREYINCSHCTMYHIFIGGTIDTGRRAIQFFFRIRACKSLSVYLLRAYNTELETADNLSDFDPIQTPNQTPNQTPSRTPNQTPSRTPNQTPKEQYPNQTPALLK